MMKPLVLCDADTNASGIIWYRHWWQMSHDEKKKVMLHLISIVLKYEIYIVSWDSELIKSIW